jgi:hypothetical protein
LAADSVAFDDAFLLGDLSVVAFEDPSLLGDLAADLVALLVGDLAADSVVFDVTFLLGR